LSAFPPQGKKDRLGILAPPKISKATLERAYQRFHREFYRDLDPVGLVHRYSHARDQEVAGFFTALLSYGNVTSIRRSAEKVLSALGPYPAEYLHELRWPSELDGFCHRFNRSEDLKVLFFWVGTALRQHGSLERLFLKHASSDLDMRPWVSGFISSLTQTPVPKRLQAIRTQRSRNLKHLLSNPESGGACKRVNMYLRWMIRPADGIDLGAWKHTHARHLILPIDTHVLKTLRTLEWTASKTASWRVAESATQRLREFCPEDPVRYDFSLCHLSMHGQDIASF
jgi:uncharacterized protein (TIGR02757 family)